MTSPFFDYEGRVVSLLGRIDSSHVDVLADQLLRLETESSEPITLSISSTGGNLIAALKIVDVMNTLQSHVTAIAMGLVQGAGVLIFATASERLILPSALLSTTGLWTMPGLEATPPSGFGSVGVQPLDGGVVLTHRAIPSLITRLRKAASAVIPITGLFILQL